MNAALHFDPLLPTGQWLGVVLAGAAVLAVYAWRRPGQIGRRRWTLANGLSMLAFAAVCLLLLNPTWTRELPPPPGKPVLSVLVDESASMAAADVNGQTRYASAATAARWIATNLSDRFDVHIDTFDQTRHANAPLKNDLPAGASTDIAAALGTALPTDTAAGAAIVLLSDGIQNQSGGTRPVLDAARLAKTLDVPVFTRTFGETTETLDLGVDLRSAQDMAIVGQRTPLTVRVTHAGLQSGRATVRLMQDGKEVAKRDADFAADAASDVHFLLDHDSAGVFPYEVRIDPLPGEAAQANNSAAYVLRVVAEPIRVLVLEGKPYWDSKFLVRTLATDPAVAVDSVVKLTDARLMRRLLTHVPPKNAKPAEKAQDKFMGRDETWQITADARAVLASADNLAGYQIVVLGRDAEAFLTESAVSTLVDWVAQQGGSLVCYRGAPTGKLSGPLEKLMPVKWDAGGGAAEGRYRLSLTKSGQQAEWLGSEGATPRATMAGMPSLVSAAGGGTPKPLASVLATAADDKGGERPAIVFQPYGAGRVVVIEGAGMWRWAFMSPKFQDQQQIYTSLWHSFMRWLSSGASLKPGQSFNLRADKARFATAEPATVTLLARGTSDAALPKIELQREGDTKTTTFVAAPAGEQAGVYRAGFGQLPEGKYTARLAGRPANDAAAQAVFDVRRYDQEQLDLRARPDLMARIAADSGGAAIDASADVASTVAERFRAYRAKSHPPQTEKSTAWDRWWVLAGIVGLWAGAWFVRRGGGLI